MESMQVELDEWCTLASGARDEDVAYPTILNWVQTGRLPATKPGRDYLVRRSDLVRIAEESRRYYGGQKKGGKASKRKRAGLV